MNAKRLMIIMLIAIFGLVCAAPSSWAGSPQQHRIEGIAIGIGALILGKAILDAAHGDHYPEVTVAAHYQARPAHYKTGGPRKTQRVWVPAQYKRAWTPGHYSHRGLWVPGHWKQIVIQPGHWVNQSVPMRRY